MRCPSLLQAVSLVLLLGAGPVACVEVPEEVVLAPAPHAGPAAVAPGLTTGCGDAGLPVGRLRGRVFPLPLGTRALPDFDALRPVGSICLDRLAVGERNGYPGFPGVVGRFEWFGIDFQGVFSVDEPGPFNLRLTSDDGARVFIDGVLVIENDGYHATRSREATVVLAPGPHTLAVPYWQGPGPMALALEVARPGEPWEVLRLDRPLGGAP